MCSRSKHNNNKQQSTTIINIYKYSQTPINMEIYFEKTNATKTIKLTKPTTLKEILQKESITIESVILVKNNCVCLEETKVNNDDKVKLLSVVSGG